MFQNFKNLEYEIARDHAKIFFRFCRRKGYGFLVDRHIGGRGVLVLVGKADVNICPCVGGLADRLTDICHKVVYCRIYYDMI